MNKARRKELSELVDGLSMMQDRDDLYGWINALDNIKGDEQDYYNNIPENLQCSQRAEDSEAAIENLDEALDMLNDVYNMDNFDVNCKLIQKAICKIEEACW